MGLLLSPWFWLALLISVLSLLGTGYYYGHKHEKADFAKQQYAAQIRADKAAAKQVAVDRQIEQNFEEARETVRTVYITIKEKANENINKHPDYAQCQLDADGLQLYNAKPGIIQADTVSGADNAMPGFTGRFGWPVGYDLAQQPGAIGALLRMPGEAPGVIRLGFAGDGGSAGGIAH